MAAERAAFRASMPTLAAEDLVFVDEAGVNRAMAPRYGRSPKGARCFGEAPRNYGQNTTLVGALTVEGISACLQVEGAATIEVFTTFVEEMLLPSLQPGQVVLLDNLSVHRRSRVEALVAQAGARVLWLPRYSPEFNAIEQAWSKLKGLLRRWEARTEAALDEAISAAFAAITASDAQGWIAHAGYTLTTN